MTVVAELDPRTVPGAMEYVKRRDLPDGSLIEFEQAPAGWLTQKGETRWKDWRAYYFTPAAHDCSPCDGTGRVAGKRDGTTRKCALCDGTGNAAKRVRLPSTTTILDAILPKPGLSVWAEARGIEGAIHAVKLGEIDPDDAASAARSVETIRALKLGADRARDVAAERGINVHALLEQYMRTGEPPNPADHPIEHHGYLRALTRWLLATNPEPVAVEQLVVSPVDGYAGRLDLKARVDGRLVLYDAKTQERCQIYAGAHLQAGLYERADVACGADRADELRVVVFAADGEYREMLSGADDAAVDAALVFWRSVRPLDSMCESANRAQREARR